MVIKYFSWVRDIANTAEEIIELPANVKNVKELIDYLILSNEKYHKIFKKRKVVKIAVNKIYVDEFKEIKNTDEIAFFPPVTGG